MITGWKKYLRYTFPVPTADDRRRLEQHIGYKLPDSYWEIAKDHQGEIPIQSYIRLKNGVMESCGVFLFLLDPGTLNDPAVKGIRGYSVIRRCGSLKGFYPRRIVPFSDDTGGNNMAFDFARRANPVSSSSITTTRGKPV